MSTVTSLSQFREKKESTSPNDPTAEDSKETFEEIMKRNKENADRIKRERAKENRSVLRDYRIK